MRRRGGFTFIEITIVVMIVLALSAVALPRMRGTLQHMRLRQGARDVASVMRLARDSAVVRGTPVMVVLSTDNKVHDQYQIELLNETMEVVAVEEQRRWHKEADSRFSIPGQEALRRRDLPDGVFFGTITSAAPLTETERACVLFYPDGTATPATITLQDVRDRTINVEIYRATGLSRIQPGSEAVKVKARPIFLRGGKDK